MMESPIVSYEGRSEADISLLVTTSWDTDDRSKRDKL